MARWLSLIAVLVALGGALAGAEEPRPIYAGEAQRAYGQDEWPTRPGEAQSAQG